MVDNEGAIAVASNPTHHSKSRHIGIRDMFFREATMNGEIKPVSVRSVDNCADHFTKILAWKLFMKHRVTIMGETV